MSRFCPTNKNCNNQKLFNKNEEQYIIDEIIKYTGVNPKGSSVNFLRGNGEPNNQLGKNGDMYINLINGDIYDKNSGVWRFVINLTGQKGTDGVPGTSFISGDGVPAPTLGFDNDVYLDLLTDNIYNKINGVWILQVNIKGEPGQPGEKGDKGQPGSGVVSLGFSATTVPVTIFLQGTTTIDPLVPTNLTGQYYNIDNTILLSGTVNITTDGYWYVQQSVNIQNQDATSYISAVDIQFLDSLNNIVYNIENNNIPTTFIGLIAGAKNLFLTAGTYRFAAVVTVSGGILPLLPTSYPTFFYGVHIFAPELTP